MNINFGFIYVRCHSSYDVNIACSTDRAASFTTCKLGKTSNIPDRDSQYATGEIKRGYFEAVYKVLIKHTDFIERLLQYEFREYNIKYDAGTEFYDKKILTLIEPCLIKFEIKYTKLSNQEINDLVRCNRVKETIKKINIQSLIQTLRAIGMNDLNKSININNLNKQIVQFTPRNYQEIIINNAVSYYKQNDKGMLIIPCGVGKTLISLWIAQKLNSNKILIGVPNKLLLKQWNEVINVLFQNIPCLTVSDGVCIENIIAFLKNNYIKCIIITTYSSAHKVYTATQINNFKFDMNNFKFDMKIQDEAHHLTSKNMSLVKDTKKYVQMLKIESIKQLSLTATLKNIITINENDENIVSNDSIEHFGKIIDKKCLLWAIEKEIVCDYVIQTIISNQEQMEIHLNKFNIKDENDKRLFLSAYASLKSIYEEHSHHLLVYLNNKDNLSKLIRYVEMLINDNYFDIPELYYSGYHSEMKPKDQKEILDNFSKSKFGIIACVYCLSEGFDMPLLDGVVFAENMSSNIRIVQSALRASRKNINEADKETKIILPVLNKNNWLENNDNNDNSDLKKVREVIYQMGLEDETIEQKIRVLKIDIEKQKIKTKNIKNKEMKSIKDLGEYDENLTMNLRLKTVKRTTLGTSYEKAKKIIAEKNIKSKENYYKLCDIDNRLSKEPEIIFKGQFTNWIEYLGIKREYYDLETCKNKVNEYLSLYPYLKEYHMKLSYICKELCKIDSSFPPEGLWVEYYNAKVLQNIIVINIDDEDEIIEINI